MLEAQARQLQSLWEGDAQVKDGSAFLNDNAQRIADGMIRDAERLRISAFEGLRSARA